jgi:phosphoribosylaminoimidazole-succinocarboxamide synthase
MEKLYEGKAKILYKTDVPDVLLMKFKDDITSGNGVKKSSMQGKGAINATTSKKIFEHLETQKGISTHYIGSPKNTEHLVKDVKIIPVEVVIRNYAAGSICRRYNIESGYKFRLPLLELFYKDDDLNDPLVNEGVVLEMKWATQEDLIKMKEMANRVNQVMVQFFKKHELTLVDFKVEFGIDKDGQLVLADELTLDSMRLWDKNGENLDKELFRQDNNIEIVLDAYQFIHRIIGADEILDLYI